MENELAAAVAAVAAAEEAARLARARGWRARYPGLLARIAAGKIGAPLEMHKKRNGAGRAAGAAEENSVQ